MSTVPAAVAAVVAAYGLGVWVVRLLGAVRHKKLDAVEPVVAITGYVCVHVCMSVCLCMSVYKYLDGWMDGWMNGWTDGRTKELP
jgi:hypothetical protein